jgi:thioredoxin 1
MHPVIDALSGELAGQAKVVKINVDEAPNVAMKYGISAIPHFAVFRGGQQTWSHTGLASKESLVQAVR